MDKIIDNTKGFHFTIIDNYILDNASLNGLEQIVYIHLKKHSVQSSKCFPGINKLAESMDISTNTIRKILKGLKEKELIDIKPRFNASNEYILLPFPEYAVEPNKEDPKEKKEEGISKVFKAYQDNINPVYGSMEREKLINWYNTFQEEGDILIKAIEEAVIQGIRKIKYIESILLTWHQWGIKNIEQVEAYQKQWEERREKKNVIGNLRSDNETDSKDKYDFSKFSNL